MELNIRELEYIVANISKSSDSPYFEVSEDENMVEIRVEAFQNDRIAPFKYNGLLITQLGIYELSNNRKLWVVKF